MVGHLDKRTRRRFESCTTFLTKANMAHYDDLDEEDEDFDLGSVLGETPISEMSADELEDDEPLTEEDLELLHELEDDYENESEEDCG